MPVNVPLCEGVSGSPDARILRKLCAGICDVVPSGSKHGMDTRVLAWREATPRSTIACLRAADLDCQWPRDKTRPQSWIKNTAVGRSVNLGWLWSRTEIENYLLDPNVVVGALGLDASTQARYREILDLAADRLSNYVAARVALSTSRVPLKSMKNKWGEQRGGDHHRFPKSLEKSSCKKTSKRSFESVPRPLDRHKHRSFSASGSCCEISVRTEIERASISTPIPARICLSRSTAI